MCSKKGVLARGTRFSTACAIAGITHTRNEPYHPEHNGKIEKFHDGLKYRCFYVLLHPRDSIERQNLHLSQWLSWYNYRKPHSGLGMNRRTPAEVVYSALLDNLSKSSCVNLMLQHNIPCSRTRSVATQLLACRRSHWETGYPAVGPEPCRRESYRMGIPLHWNCGSFFLGLPCRRP